MNSINSTISTNQKGQHLALTDWITIQIMHEQGQSLRQIAASLNCSPTTVKYELERGQISLYHGKRYRYDAQEAQRRFTIILYHGKRYRYDAQEAQRRFTIMWNLVYYRLRQLTCLSA